MSGVGGAERSALELRYQLPVAIDARIAGKMRDHPTDAATGNVFIAAGGLEDMIRNTQRLADELKATASSTLRVHYEEIAGKTHTSVVPVALTRGLRWALR